VVENALEHLVFVPEERNIAFLKKLALKVPRKISKKEVLIGITEFPITARLKNSQFFLVVSKDQNHA
jgi:hypothetical protein